MCVWRGIVNIICKYTRIYVKHENFILRIYLKSFIEDSYLQASHLPHFITKSNLTPVTSNKIVTTTTTTTAHPWRSHFKTFSNTSSRNIFCPQKRTHWITHLNTKPQDVQPCMEHHGTYSHHPWKERKIISQTSMIIFHVNLQVWTSPCFFFSPLPPVVGPLCPSVPSPSRRFGYVDEPRTSRRLQPSVWISGPVDGTGSCMVVGSYIVRTW